MESALWVCGLGDEVLGGSHIVLIAEIGSKARGWETLQVPTPAAPAEPVMVSKALNSSPPNRDKKGIDSFSS